MTEMIRFPFFATERSAGISFPYLPLILTHQGNSISVSGLLDTGATVNVLPHSMGKRLGAVWDEQTAPLQLAGNLANSEARSLVVSATVAEFEPVRMAFAWTQADNIPLILGQVNFLVRLPSLPPFWMLPSPSQPPFQLGQTNQPAPQGQHLCRVRITCAAFIASSHAHREGVSRFLTKGDIQK